MVFQSILLFFLVGAGLSTPIASSLESRGPPPNATFIQCIDGTTDPICQLIHQPSHEIITEIIHPNGTMEIKRNLYTRDQLQAIRARNNVTSIEYQPGEAVQTRNAETINSPTKRESAPPACWSETQKWYDTHDWGYWYQPWKQVGNCFYCDQCTEAIATSFAVTQTWTVGLDAKFGDVITVSFGFSWGQTFSLSDTRTCQWNWVEYGCHSLWYQPLMTYHNGYANYQTHTHCGAGQGEPASDSYSNHNWAFANVNQAVTDNNGVNRGNLGCNSGCEGNDHRQCQYGNNGGVLWPNAN
ncbi:hypothetical protein BP6252_13766 [Coleophoma cylindrospora]|uniref:Uncharacterized protein n=1 Tax=Coleophoma cylindrospora TaxID=1849047 RepID=A0A3D8Q6P3_9HELO|nr:hypothetical protein BP6252_13766 [Coleophoma cylindrospora]